ncbi:MAG: amino acid--[acyl-carrier-protein] ligase [Acidimicrobiales bacterium]
MRSALSTEQWRDSLVEAGMLIPTGVGGLFGHSQRYESIVSGLASMVHRLGAGQGATVLNFPPVVPRQVFERTGFLESFTNLVGAVRCFSGSGEDHARFMKALSAGEDWSAHFGPADLAVASAACHPVYPLCGGGELPPGGRRFEVSSYCFRHEPSVGVARMQAFRMHEHVYVGEAAAALRFRDDWLAAASGALRDLGLDVAAEPANDPFFGRGAGLLAELQREEERKIELVVALPGDAAPTAVASGNWHQDHFGVSFEIKSAGGEVAHSACMAFGLDRLTLALLAAHGLDTDRWPVSVRSRLWA